MGGSCFCLTTTLLVGPSACCSDRETLSSALATDRVADDLCVPPVERIFSLSCLQRAAFLV